MKFEQHGHYPFRVTLEQTDALGLIHNSVVFRLFEVAELEWFRKLGIHWLEFPDHIFPRIKVEAEFLKPLRFDDVCILKSFVTNVKSCKVILEHEIYSSEMLMIRGRIEFAALNKKTFSPVILPEKMSTILNQNR